MERKIQYGALLSGGVFERRNPLGGVFQSCFQFLVVRTGVIFIVVARGGF